MHCVSWLACHNFNHQEKNLNNSKQSEPLCLFVSFPAKIWRMNSAGKIYHTDFLNCLILSNVLCFSDSFRLDYVSKWFGYKKRYKNKLNKYRKKLEPV